MDSDHKCTSRLETAELMEFQTLQSVKYYRETYKPQREVNIQEYTVVLLRPQILRQSSSWPIASRYLVV
jgi:hypothetical protein